MNPPKPSDAAANLRDRVERIKRELAEGRLVIDCYKLADALLAKEPGLGT